jgi:uncharacterized membrane protein YcaP (DUF421 family)
VPDRIDGTAFALAPLDAQQIGERLRERGVENLQQVKTAYLESGGEVSVILFGSPAALRPSVSRPEVP